MMSRPMLVSLALALSLSSLMACSADDGRPSDETGGMPSAGTGTGTETPAPAGEPAPTPTPTSTGTTTPPPAAPAAKKALLEGCAKDDECMSNVCYLGDQGSYCSLKCTAETASTVCVAPLAGTCNKKGFCKKP